jgi:L-cystine transport system permease protein
MQSTVELQNIFNNIVSIIPSLPVTLLIAFVSMFMGALLGLGIALIKIYRTPGLHQFFALYVSFARGTPLLVQLLLIYYGVPALVVAVTGLVAPGSSIDFNKVDPVWFALIAYSINMSAYLSETLRASIESVDRGQIEAANSIGLKSWQVMLKIVLPQAALNAIPNLGNSLIGLVKETSLVFMITVVDVMGMAKILGARSLRFLEAYIAVSLIYWVTCIILEFAFRYVEKRLSVSRRKLAE